MSIIRLKLENGRFQRPVITIPQVENIMKSHPIQSVKNKPYFKENILDIMLRENDASSGLLTEKDIGCTL